MWEKIDTAPRETDIQLAVIDTDGTHSLVFPCRKTGEGWVNAETGKRIVVHPTHWRVWPNGAANEF